MQDLITQLKKTPCGRRGAARIKELEAELAAVRLAHSKREVQLMAAQAEAASATHKALTALSLWTLDYLRYLTNEGRRPELDRESKAGCIGAVTAITKVRQEINILFAALDNGGEIKR